MILRFPDRYVIISASLYDGIQFEDNSSFPDSAQAIEVLLMGEKIERKDITVGAGPVHPVILS